MSDHKHQRLARELQHRENIRYTEALRRVRTPAEITAYNARYGHMDAAFSCLSRHCRVELNAHRELRLTEALIGTMRDWWGVRGVPDGTAEVMAAKIAGLRLPRWVFGPGPLDDDTERFAADLVRTVVYETRANAPATRSGKRREFSLASKTLHWLLPWRIPAYDSYVCAALGVSNENGDTAYPQVARGVLGRVRAADGRSLGWMGDRPPHSPLRAVDKQLWWTGGGHAGTARVVTDPWALIDRLGLSRNGPRAA